MRSSDSKMIKREDKPAKFTIDFRLKEKFIVTVAINLTCTQLEFAASLEWLSLHITSYTHFQSDNFPTSSCNLNH
jgi:hypothetical protein